MKILLLIILVIIYIFIGMIIGALFHILSNLDSIEWYDIIIILFWPPFAVAIAILKLIDIYKKMIEGYGK